MQNYRKANALLRNEINSLKVVILSGVVAPRKINRVSKMILKI